MYCQILKKLEILKTVPTNFQKKTLRKCTVKSLKKIEKFKKRWQNFHKLENSEKRAEI